MMKTVADPDWLLLDEAVASGSLEVTEVSEAGTVPALLVVNRGARAVLLLDGEELVGAKQNRILNTSVLIAAGQTLTIPVSCVERGRGGAGVQVFRRLLDRVAVSPGMPDEAGGPITSDETKVLPWSPPEVQELKLALWAAYMLKAMARLKRRAG